MPQDVIAKIKKILKTSDKLNFTYTNRLSKLLGQSKLKLETLSESEKVRAFKVGILTKHKLEISKFQDLKKTDFSNLGQVSVEDEVSYSQLTYTARAICNWLSSIRILST